MAGEGSKYLVGRATKEARRLLANFSARTKNSRNQTGLLSPDLTKVTMPDGSVIDVTILGQPNRLGGVVSRTSNGKGVLASRDLTKCIIGGSSDYGYILERISGDLYVRRIGGSTRVQINNPFSVEVQELTGGFSSDGNSFYLAGATVENGGADVNVYWVIYTGWSLTSSGDISYEASQTGIEDLNQAFEENIVTEMESPTKGSSESLGLVGADRYKNLYYFLDEGAEIPDDPPSAEEVIEFVNFITEYFELTEQEADILFPAEFWATAFATNNSDSRKFNPPTYRLFDAENFSYVIPDFDGLPGLYTTDPGSTTNTQDYWDGFYTGTWTPESNIKPYFREISLVFNNNAAGSPILDIIATYETTDLYVKDAVATDTAFSKVSTHSSSAITFSSYKYSRVDSETYGYSYDVDIVYTPTLDREVTAVYMGPLIDNYNFYLESLGGYVSLLGENGTGYYARYYTTAALAECAPGSYETETCPYVEYSIGPGYFAIEAARFTFFGGHPIITNLYPPDTSTYRMEYWDDDSNITYNYNFGGDDLPVYPADISPFMTSYPFYYEPAWGGYYCTEDSAVWGGTVPEASVVQTGRGVMSVQNANGSKVYDFIDRPPAAPRHYDSIWRVYLGVSGGRALLTKDSEFDAYAYAQNYVTTSNQIVGLEPPDTFTEIYYIEQDTWPFESEQIKPVDSRDFVYYNTESVSGDGGSSVNEFVVNVNVAADGTTTIGKTRSGPIPSGGGEILDYVIVGSSYV